MTRNQILPSFVLAIVATLSLAGCKDSKTLQENAQLKTQVAELQKENGELGNNLETVTAARDDLAKENDRLKAQLRARKSKPSEKKMSKKKHHRR